MYIIFIFIICLVMPSLVNPVSVQSPAYSPDGVTLGARVSTTCEGNEGYPRGHVNLLVESSAYDVIKSEYTSPPPTSRTCGESASSEVACYVIDGAVATLLKNASVESATVSGTFEGRIAWQIAVPAETGHLLDAARFWCEATNPVADRAGFSSLSLPVSLNVTCMIFICYSVYELVYFLTVI